MRRSIELSEQKIKSVCDSLAVYDKSHIGYE